MFMTLTGLKLSYLDAFDDFLTPKSRSIFNNADFYPFNFDHFHPKSILFNLILLSQILKHKNFIPYSRGKQAN